ncbi:FAD-binding oxidoreductase [Mesorhizobium captivum]|uniref:FAD-binding oxidoreductase n=1 Tax=Mesorhizobium captivum TaxID=3072319 RepID=UPI002A245428|nr:FAD-binding oxidoreductase [Mesorhizobium sp. VK3C]MDX8448307.1 FAD-binding oxidoreductase [Mesorhizobium sp. VK3C]
MNDENISKFAQSLLGPLIGRDHVDYDEVRKLYNGMIEKRPLFIARCVDVADVIAAVNFGRESGLMIAIRGGGHNGAGFGSVDDGLVIDLSLMKGVRVEPAKRTVRVGAGCTTGDVDHATHAFGLAIPFGIVSTTGVAGLTLSGGHGYLSRQYGLASDNLLEADVVLADGTFVTAAKTDNSDLLWGLRGGGGNFGVVTSFLFKAHPASVVYGGPIFWELKDAATIMRWYRDFQASAPDEFYVFLGLQTVPSGDPFPKEHWGKKICVLLISHNGAAADAEKAVNSVRAALPKPIIDFAGLIPYTVLQGMFDGLYPKGLQWYWKGDFVQMLPDAAIDAHIQQAAKVPSEVSCMHLYPIDGAVHRMSEEESSWNCRDATWSMVIAGVGSDPAQAPALKKWAKDYWEAVHPFDLNGAYPNFMMDDEGEARLKATYGENYKQLRKLKKKYDPGNLFRVNHNIRPAA